LITIFKLLKKSNTMMVEQRDEFLVYK